MKNYEVLMTQKRTGYTEPFEYYYNTTIDIVKKDMLRELGNNTVFTKFDNRYEVHNFSNGHCYWEIYEI